MIREQSLLNAQVEVNRAVFLMNEVFNPGHPEWKDLDCSDEAILKHIDLAIKDLQEARKGYLRQGDLFPMEASV